MYFTLKAFLIFLREDSSLKDIKNKKIYWHEVKKHFLNFELLQAFIWN